MPNFDHDTIVPYKESALSKKKQVEEMFDQISGKYDFLNRFLSAGIDVTWRKKALRFLKSYQPKKILDVATGTGDFAILANEILQPEFIEGVDLSEGMLQVGRKKMEAAGLQNKIRLTKGDSEDLQFPDNSFDAATVAFGVRNFQNLERGLSELKRVLKNDGQMLVLEFSTPKTPIVKTIFNLYMNYITPQVGRVVSKNKEAYSYLDESIKKFPEGQNFTRIMESLGFHNIHRKTFTFGICTMYFGQK